MPLNFHTRWQLTAKSSINGLLHQINLFRFWSIVGGLLAMDLVALGCRVF